MGGPCDFSVIASTPNEMIDKGMAHVKKIHPELAVNMNNIVQNEKDKWYDTFMNLWKKTPNN